MRSGVLLFLSVLALCIHTLPAQAQATRSEAEQVLEDLFSAEDNVAAVMAFTSARRLIRDLPASGAAVFFRELVSRASAVNDPFTYSQVLELLGNGFENSEQSIRTIAASEARRLVRESESEVQTLALAEFAARRQPQLREVVATKLEGLLRSRTALPRDRRRALASLLSGMGQHGSAALDRLEASAVFDSIDADWLRRTRGGGR